MSAGRIGNHPPMTPPGISPGQGQGPAAATPKGAEAEFAKEAGAAAAVGLTGPAISEGPEGPGGPNSPDASVQISEGARNRAEGHRKALHIARNTPDIREDRVASLKKQIDEGSYKPDSGKIADGMLREAIKDHLAENEA